MRRLVSLGGLTRRSNLAPSMAISVLLCLMPPGSSRAQTAAGPSVTLPDVEVDTSAGGNSGKGGYAANGRTQAKTADFGPLGQRRILDTPTSIAVVPQDVLVNQQAKQVNDTLRFLPSVEVRDQQGFDISRPQSRGFQGSIVQNTRLDGLNVIGTTAIAAENLSRVEVLNGLAGALYGPETPAGVFNYVLKRPTDVPIFRYVESFDSQNIFTEQIDTSGFMGPDNRIGYRVNLVHGQGESYVKDSYTNRTLGSIALDYHFDNRTVIETNFGHYATDGTGLPGSVVYNGTGTKSTLLPNGLDPTRPGLGQPGAGVNLRSDTGVVKLKHDFNEDWQLDIGGLYENAVRNLYGITNTITNNNGADTVVKNFTAVPRFTVASNTAYLNGHFDAFGTRNDLTIGTNGFVNGQYSYRNSIATTLGTSNIFNPAILPTKLVPATGGLYVSTIASQQTIVTGDTMHFNDQVAVQGVLSTSFLNSKAFAASGLVTSGTTANAALSPTVSLIYKPIPVLTTYFTFSDSVEQGDQAPAGTVNVNQILAPYRDRQYEVGVKYAVKESLLVTLAAFRMTRPLAFADPVSNIFQVEGTQRNYGLELFAQGGITPELSVLGGVTYLDPRLQNTGNATTNDKLVVGVPHYKSDVLLDYHPDVFRGGALTAAGHYESVRAATNTNNSYADAFATFDLGARYTTTIETHHATFRLQVINVGDTRYYVSVADGNIVGSAGANTAYVGTPRTLEASLELDF